jgi:hypothetical protein
LGQDQCTNGAARAAVESAANLAFPGNLARETASRRDTLSDARGKSVNLSA